MGLLLTRFVSLYVVDMGSKRYFCHHMHLDDSTEYLPPSPLLQYEAIRDKLQAREVVCF